jgi:DnaK suppressor protein
MSNTDFTSLKSILETKLAAIAAGSSKRADIAIQQSPDSLDETRLAVERDLAVSLLNRDAQLSRRIQGALRRMEDGAYGVCLDCQEPIRIMRLRAVPWAELCLGCQERADLAGAGVPGAAADESVELETA